MNHDNAVKRNCREGRPSLGAYVTLSPSAVELAAVAGLDFVRLDPYHSPCGLETFAHMVRAAYATGVVPWARVRNDPYDIMTALDLGVQAITVPNCGTAADARAAVDAVHYPPLGRREMGRPLRMRDLGTTEYLEWSRSQLLLSVQIEGAEGLANHREIVRVEGVDCIQTGRNDLSQALGVPGEDLHPKVLDAEKRIVSAALEAGRDVSLVHSLDDDGLERAARWIEQGVKILTVEPDWMVLLSALRGGVKALRG